MSGMNLLEKVRTGPVTQSVDAIKALLAFVGRGCDPLPSDVSLDNGRLVLVLNGKKDAYYSTTAAACSCPAAHWHKGPCKHMRKYFPETTKPAATAAETGSIRPEGKWPGGRNGPVDLLPSEEKAAEAA